MHNPIFSKKHSIALSGYIPLTQQGRRLDQTIAHMFPDYSRATLTHWIRQGCVKLNQVIVTQPRQKVWAGQSVLIKTEITPRENWIPQTGLPLTIVHEDNDIIIVNKPAGLVIHPGNGNPDGTLLNALLNHDYQLQFIPRAGIVHRLDKNTTGLLVVARTLTAYKHLTSALQLRKVHREYEAIVHGAMVAGSTINAPIQRHPHQRTRMAIAPDNKGKPAVTHYRLITAYAQHSHIRLILETGRTHQIRVHMAYQHHPVVGDPTYSGRKKWSASTYSPDLVNALNRFPRQALHARRLSFYHPTTGQWRTWELPLPQDMQELLHLLNEDQSKL